MMQKWLKLGIYPNFKWKNFLGLLVDKKKRKEEIVGTIFMVGQGS